MGHPPHVSPEIRVTKHGSLLKAGAPVRIWAALILIRLPGLARDRMSGCSIGTALISFLSA